ncbi:MAG: hypothetical protein F6K54_37465 [Okeania sp. SIO3B5]|uniref:hypothetical protein n=1 Tax=Okeania sp. SIO3B5 TaxID=2607811 RepID=UPI001400AF06|nr:hypothetical protein [Okeania sp. SIO3B5]NEO58248.1 hypothetical protein [Okeania sp. SIO3B5]
MSNSIVATTTAGGVLTILGGVATTGGTLATVTEATDLYSYHNWGCRYYYYSNGNKYSNFSSDRFRSCSSSSTSCSRSISLVVTA